LLSKSAPSIRRIKLSPENQLKSRVQKLVETYKQINNQLKKQKNEIVFKRLSSFQQLLNKTDQLLKSFREKNTDKFSSVVLEAKTIASLKLQVKKLQNQLKSS